MINIEDIKKAQLFQGIDESALEKLSSLGQEKSFSKGHVLFREGDDARGLYILKEGRVSLDMRIKAGEGQQVQQATVDVARVGEAFGWSSLVEPYKYTLSAYCLEPVKVLFFEAEKVRELLDSDVASGYKVMKKMARLVSSRLEHTRNLLLSERGMANIPSWNY